MLASPRNPLRRATSAALLVATLTLSSAAASASSTQVLPSGQVVTASVMPNSVVTPVSGELRGPDSQADITEVAWPSEADGYVANRGDRLVAFTVQLTEPASDTMGFGSSGPTLSLVVQGSPETLDATDSPESYVAAVPSDTHAVDVSMNDAGFTQSLSLWTLERTSPAPQVLYDDPTSSGETEQIGVTKWTTIRDRSGGTYATGIVVTSARLTAFDPDGTNAPAPPSHAYLTLDMTAESAEAAYESFDYLASVTPIPGRAVTLTTGRRRYVAIRSNVSGDPGAVGNDDGMLDARYSFLVPSDTTRGIVAIGPATTSGLTYHEYVFSDAPDALDVEGPVRFSVGFPPPPKQAAQPTPPWVGEPAHDNGLSGDAGAPSSGLPIGVALLVLALIVGALFVVRRRSRTHSPGPIPAPVEPVAEPGVPATAPAPEVVPGSTLRIDVVGPVRITPLQELPSEFARAFLTYVAAHDDRPRSVDDAQTALWPLDSTETDVTRKTFLNYVSEVRRLRVVRASSGEPEALRLPAEGCHDRLARAPGARSAGEPSIRLRGPRAPSRRAAARPRRAVRVRGLQVVPVGRHRGVAHRDHQSRRERGGRRPRRARACRRPRRCRVGPSTGDAVQPCRAVALGVPRRRRPGPR